MKINHKSGFTLIEIAMALLITAIGLLGMMALFPNSLDQSKKASGDTFAALFAEEVMGGVRAYVSTYTDGFENLESIQLSSPAHDLWVNADDLVIVASSGNEVYTNKYVARVGDDTEPDLVDHALRFQLKINDVPGREDFVKYVQLRVWDGEYGSQSNKDSTVHYSEVYNWKM